MNNKGTTTFRVPLELKDQIEAEAAKRQSTRTIEMTMLLTEALEARRRSGSRPEGTDPRLIARVDALERELRKVRDLLREQMPRGDLA